jgi:hypothetical protein
MLQQNPTLAETGIVCFYSQNCDLSPYSLIIFFPDQIFLNFSAPVATYEVLSKFYDRKIITSSVVKPFLCCYLLR